MQWNSYQTGWMDFVQHRVRVYVGRIRV